MNQSASDAVHGKGRAKMLQGMGLKAKGQVCQVPGFCLHFATHGVTMSLRILGKMSPLPSLPVPQS